MTPLLTKWREQEEEFDRKFKIFEQINDSEVDGTFAIEADKDKVKDFHRQSLIAIIEGEILRLEGEKMVNTKEEENSDWFYGYGFNAAIDQQISYYQSTLEGLKK